MFIPITRLSLAAALLLPLLGCTKQSRMHTKALLGGRESKREYGVWLYDHGREREQQEALTWITRAANAGDQKAMYELGMILSAGGHFWAPNPKAVEWFRKGAEAGDRTCMNKLADAYCYGLMGLTKNQVVADKWYAKARAAKKPGEM